jgi:hypothetical protein
MKLTVSGCLLFVVAVHLASAVPFEKRGAASDDLATSEVNGDMSVDQPNQGPNADLNGQLLETILAGLKVAVKKQLESYNTNSGGVIFPFIDKLIPTKATPIDGLDISQDVLNSEQLVLMLMQRGPEIREVLEALKDRRKIPALAIKFMKNHLAKEYPAAGLLVEAYEDPWTIPVHVMNAIKDGSFRDLAEYAAKVCKKYVCSIG